MTAGEFARQIKKPYTTVATWLRKGQVPGAVPQIIGDFRIWMVPEEAVHTFEQWQPKPGRPVLTEDEKAARAKKRAAKTTSKGLSFKPSAVPTKPKTRAKKANRKTAKKGAAAK